MRFFPDFLKNNDIEIIFFLAWFIKVTLFFIRYNRKFANDLYMFHKMGVKYFYRVVMTWWTLTDESDIHVHMTFIKKFYLAIILLTFSVPFLKHENKLIKDIFQKSIFEFFYNWIFYMMCFVNDMMEIDFILYWYEWCV